MSFLHPQLLWLLGLPLLFWIRDLSRRPHAATAAGKILTANAGPGGVALTRSTSTRRAPVRWRLTLGLIFTILAIARPQWGRIEEAVFDQSREIIVAIDLSRSMLADDVKPNRLERARLLTQSLLENTPGERVGLVVFAGTAFLQSPLSSDHEIIRDFLPLLDPTFLPAGGTNYAALLQTSLDAFSDSQADRFLIVLSDGETADDDWRDLAKTCRERGIRILTLGIGTTDGAMLPDGQGGLIKDERGAVVLSKLDGTTLRDLATETDGVYTDASQWVDLAALVQATVDRGRTGDFKESSRIRLAERYQWALAPALFLLLWSFWREFPVRIDSTSVGRLRHGATAAALLLAGLLPDHHARAQDAPPSLAELAATLSQKPKLTADDYATFASGSLAHSESLHAQGQPTPASIIDDGLAATDAGRRLDPQAADWDGLQKSLEAQRKDPPKPPPSEDNKKQPPSDKSDDEKLDSKDSDQKQDSGDSDEKSGEQSDQESGEKSKDPSKSSDQNPSGEPNSDASSGDQSDAEDSNPQKPAQSAFGEMTPPEQTDDAQPQPAPSEAPSDEPAPDPGETQRVGGASTDQPQTDDPALMQTLQSLEQIKGKDSPARLFQLLQDPNNQPAAPAGQTW